MLKLLLRWTLMAAGAAGTVYLLLVAIGSFFPPRIDITAGIVVNRPPDNVWWVLTDYRNLAVWHPQYKSSAALSPPGEKPFRWRITYTDGYQVTAEVVNQEYPSHLEERIVDKDLPFGGGWSVDLARVGPNTQVTAHSQVEIHRPIDRLFVHLLAPPQAELYRILEALKSRVETVSMKAPAVTGG